MNPNHQIHIITPRLIIRALLPEDAQGMFEMDSNPEVHRYLGNKPIQTIKQAQEVITFVQQQYIDNGIGRWAIIEKESNEFVGWTGFKLITEKINGHSRFLDFGYRLSQKHWNKGYATEAGKAALAYGISNFGFKEVYGMTDVANKASRKVLEKLGFEFISEFKYDGEQTWRGEEAPTTWYKLNQNKMVLNH